MLHKLPIPIIQSPMVGASTFEMTLAVSRTGGMGFVGAGAMAPAEIESEVSRLRAATGRPFGVNLFVLAPAKPSQDEVDAAIERLHPWYARLGLEPPAPPNDFAPDFQAQFAALLRAAPPAASFTFGLIAPEQAAALQAAGTCVIGTATTVAEAKAWAEVGADAISAQGAEAGGHRGTFLKSADESLIGTFALVGGIRQAVDLPVIAAGGIMDGRGVAAALALGAVAAQMGTAFLLSDQSGASATWQTALAAAGDDPTRLTRALTGRYARGVENQFMSQMRAIEGEVPTYPVQNRLTQPLRAAAAKAGDPQVLSLWAGQGIKQAGGGDAGDLVKRWWAEAQGVAGELAARTAGQ
jgi:nitronate monooxygenase